MLFKACESLKNENESFYPKRFRQLQHYIDLYHWSFIYLMPFDDDQIICPNFVIIPY